MVLEAGEMMVAAPPLIFVQVWEMIDLPVAAVADPDKVTEDVGNVIV